MKKRVIFLLILLLSASSYADNATILFSSAQDCKITIYEPIDGGYNYGLPTKELKATANIPCIYTTDISSYCIIKCEFSQGTNCEVILFPNDSIKIHVNNKQIRFEGSNKEGLQYLQDIFVVNSQYELYMGPMQNLLSEYVKQKREFNTIMPEIKKNIVLPTMKAIDEIALNSTTTPDFVNVLRKDMLIQYNSFLIILLRSTLEVEEYKITAIKDSTEIVNTIDSLFKVTAPLEKGTLKYDYNLYISQYLIFYYGEDAPDGFGENIFGSYGSTLYAPEDMHPIILGEGYLYQMERNKPAMNLPKVKKFFNEKFPDSQYTAIINEKTMKEDEEVPEDFNYSYITQRIDSLSQLKNITELKNKYIFIDLWASWCMPCRQEFKYKEELGRLLTTYKEICIVYISIDGSSQEDSWQQCIKKYKLSGFHLLASDVLQKSIQEQIYGSHQFTIPRYILLNPNGEIMHNNLPRPSHIKDLKEALDKVIIE